MESLTSHFNRITRQNPYWSSLICFNETMKTRNFSNKIITDGFKFLVEKSDYSRSMYDTLLEQAMNLNSTPK